MHPITIANGYNDRIKPRSCGASNLKCSVLRSAGKYLHKKEKIIQPDNDLTNYIKVCNSILKNYY